MLKRPMLLFLLAAVSLPLAAQDESFGDKARQLLQEGTDLYKKGKLQEALAKFEEAFQMKPSSDLIYAYMQRAGSDLVASMMNSEDRKISDLGRRLFELAKPGEPLRMGKKEVLKYIDDLKATDSSTAELALWHLKNFGPWAARFLVPLLGEEKEHTLRSRVIRLLTEMGYDASLAVTEALKSKSEFVRQQAAIVLGYLKDERAIPALKRVLENGDEKQEVKKFADEALRRIIRDKGPEQWRKAAEYYYELATKYYYSDPSVILSWQRSYLLWKWDPSKNILTERKVARMAYNEQLAEDALFDLLTLDPEFVDAKTGLSAWSLFICVHFAEAIEAEAAVMAALEALKNSEIDRAGLARMVSEIEGLGAQTGKALADQITAAASDSDVQKFLKAYFVDQAKVIRANVLAQVPGKKYLYEALGRCLADGNYLVAQSCIEAIEEMGRPEDLPAPPPPPDAPVKEETAGAQPPLAVDGTIGHPLIEALTNEDKRVRYAAAKAMVALNPQRRKLGMELVIPNLIDALGEQGIRVALIIYDVQDDRDRNFINGLKKTLVSLNVFPVVATSGVAGVIEAKRFPTEDVIIIQKKIAAQIYFREDAVKKPVVETVFDTLRDDVRTRSIPRILLSEDAAEDTEAKKIYAPTAQGWILKDVSKIDLNALLEKTFDTPEAKKDSKDRANGIARAAAETLARIDPTNTLYPYRDAVEPLIKTVNPDPLRDDSIRIPSCHALGRYGDQRAVDVLAKVLNDKDSDAVKAKSQKGVRLASIKALSQIFQKTGITPTEEVFAVLLKNVRDGEYDIEMGTAEAAGNTKLTNKQRFQISEACRLTRETYTADDP